MVRYELPRLPYRYDELEPYIDAQTMQIHHQKHHAYYVDGLNKILGEISAVSHPQYITSILSDMDSVPADARTLLNFYGGGFANHKMFWEVMTPDGGGSPGGRLGDVMDIYFGGFENFRDLFSSEALSIQGSGWCWLVLEQTYGKIELATTTNQDSPWAMGKIPLLGLDVWEHAYYLQYQGNRRDYVENWWNLINWDYVENRFVESSTQ